MNDILHPVLDKFFPCDSKEQAELVNRFMTPLEVSSGDVIFSAGDPADSVYFILEGCVAVQKPIGIGDRSQVIALLNAGTVIGEAAVVEGRFRATTVTAAEDSRLVVFSQAGLAKLEQAAPAVFIKMMKIIVSITSLRLQKSSERLALVL